MLKPGSRSKLTKKNQAKNNSTVSKKTTATPSKKKPTQSAVKKTTSAKPAVKRASSHAKSALALEKQTTTLLNSDYLLNSKFASITGKPSGFFFDAKDLPAINVNLPDKLPVITKEESIRLNYDGLSTSVTPMQPPMRMMSFGAINKLRWWDAKTLVTKTQDFTFEMPVATADEKTVTISRVWSDTKQKKIFYVKDSQGRVENLNDVDASTFHFYFTEEALKEAADTPIVLCEGFRAAAHLRENGINAVGTIDAGTMPVKEVLEKFKDRKVILWPDNDDVGVRYMSRLRNAFLQLGVNADHLIQWRGGHKNADAADIVKPKDLEKLVDTSTPWHAELLEAISQPTKLKRVGQTLKLRANSMIARGGR